MNYKCDITSVKGIGDKSSEAFRKLNINTVEDLIYYFPRTYERFEEIVKLKDVVEGERNAVYLSVASDASMVRLKGKIMISARLGDGSGEEIEVKYFNAAYLAKTLKRGTSYVFRGYVRRIKGRLMMSQPRMYKLDEYKKIEGTIGPVYTVTKDITSSRISKAVKEVIDLTRHEEDYLSPDEIKDNMLCPIKDALHSIHFPGNEASLYYARRRLVFEEFLSFYHMIKTDNFLEGKVDNDAPFIETATTKRFEEALPFELTASQKHAVRDIFDDMTGPYLCNRLIQGDVGSGKTIVAIEALLMNADNGFQGALMAPTEVLATQHFKTINDMTSKMKLPLKPVLLHGKMPKKAREEALKAIESGECNVVIGTHALFQEGVKFKALKLVITDEQHRFGVNQRESLRDKGYNPHIIVMSATPIPRTLAMIMYGNVDISVMNELPKNRLPINTCVVNSGFMGKSLEFIKNEIQKGHQAYVICPMIDETEEDNFNLNSVSEFAEKLKEYYGECVSVGILHGKLKGEEKAHIMEDFKSRNYDILVSTTVVEVGVDVPNATVIMILNAERFGLSQLHQLRGRVGRSDIQSYCILVSDNKSEASVKRLKVLNETNDGFEIARRDMKLRGPGELAGQRQSGALSFELGDIYEDSDILMLVTEMYDNIKDRIGDRKGGHIDFRTI